MDAQPPNSCNANSGVPFCTCQLAQVCRRSCQRKSSIPSAFEGRVPRLCAHLHNRLAAITEHVRQMLPDLLANERYRFRIERDRYRLSPLDALAQNRAREPRMPACDIMISYLALGNLMAQFVVRDLEDAVKARLKRRAERHGRSMEEEVRDILRNAAKEENRPLPNLGSRIAARFAKTGLSDDLPELRGQAPRPAEIGK